MSEKLPYGEDEKWSDLPLPDSELSWQRMEKLLDKDEKKHHILPPYLLRGCAAVMVLSGVLFIAAWYFTESDKKENTISANTRSEVMKDEVTKVNEHKQSTLVQADTIAKKDSEINNKPRDTAIGSEVEQELKLGYKIIFPAPKIAGDRSGSVESSLVTKRKNVNNSGSINVLSATRKAALKKGGHAAHKKQLHVSDSMIDTKINDQEVPVNSQKDQLAEVKPNVQLDINGHGINGTALLTTEAAVKDTTALQSIKKNTTKKYVWGAGVGLQQQIPFGGQSAVPYNYYGRKGYLYDYIPSIYVRLQRDEKWFIQGEFRYGAPQTIKDISYSRQTKPDSSSMVVTSTRLRVKKTYYHQLPLSVNYYVLPNWSVGGGGIYSHFYRAVTEQEVRNTNLQSGTETLAKKIIQVPGFTDSFFYKSQVQIFLQTEYQWRRFTLGLRYKMDLQPFIKYTKPDGLVDEEKNQSLEAILRYRLWQSKNK